MMLPVHVLQPGSAGYPARLAGLKAERPVLYCIGEPFVLTLPKSMAVVGTRQPNESSLNIASELVSAAVSQGFVVVSGMAAGVDAAAHESALDSSGFTVAVLAGGPDKPFPPENRDLYRRIIGLGCVVSASKPGTMTSKGLLVARNRLIAGLADVVVVIQAPAGSGAMYAARAALSMNRCVAVLEPPEHTTGFEGNRRLSADSRVLVLNRKLAYKDWLDAIQGKGSSQPGFCFEPMGKGSHD